jgi:hypothetical protein
MYIFLVILLLVFYAKIWGAILRENLLMEILLVILFLGSLLLSRIKLEIKIIFLIIFYGIFRVNVNLTLLCLKLAYMGSKGIFVENEELCREMMRKFFDENFRFSNEFNKLPEKPSIYVCNYCYDRVENFSYLTIPRKLSLILTKGNIEKFNVIQNCIITNGKGDEYKFVKESIKKSVEQGRSIIVYISSHKQHIIGKIGRIRSGIFRIAKELEVPVTPIAFDYIHQTYGYIPYQNFRVHVGHSFMVDNVENSMYNVRQFFKNKLKFFMKNKFRNT